MTNSIAKFWAHADVRGPDECWPWIGNSNPEGYCKFWLDGKRWPVHVLAYVLRIGPVPDGLTVDHLCHVAGECMLGNDCPHRRCCNPAHLDAKTLVENAMRGNSLAAAHSAKERCPKCGGEYFNESKGGGQTARRCRGCRDLYQREYRERRRRGSTLSA